MVSGRQIRAARALLDWSGQELADKCGISLKMLRRYEPQNGIPAGNTKVLESIKSVLQSQGSCYARPSKVKSNSTLSNCR